MGTVVSNAVLSLRAAFEYLYHGDLQVLVFFDDQLALVVFCSWSALVIFEAFALLRLHFQLHHSQGPRASGRHECSEDCEGDDGHTMVLAAACWSSGLRANGENDRSLIISCVWQFVHSLNVFVFGYGHSPLVLFS